MTQNITKTILFTHYGDNGIRGSERCLLDLLGHLDKQKFRPIVWCNSNKMYEAVTDLGIIAFQSSFSLLMGWHSPKFALSESIKLMITGIQLVKEYKVSLIHANSGAPCQWLNFVARWCKVPIVAHLHSHYPLRDRLTLGLHHVNKAVGVSQPVIQQLHNDGVAEKALMVIPNGIDINRLQKQAAISLREKLNLHKDDFVIASVGSLIHCKGFDILIAAVATLKTLGVLAKLVIIGEGEEKSNLQKIIEQQHLQHDVFLLGEQSNIYGLLKGDVNVFVSGAREEAFGLVLAEAGLAGLATVAPRTGGIPEVIKDNETGLLFDPENRHELVLDLVRCYQNPTLCQRLGQQAQSHVKQHFPIQRNVTRFEQLYLQQMSSQASQTGWFSHWRFKPFIKSCSQIAILYLKPKMKGAS